MTEPDADPSPTLELLEANHEFPCRYVFKAIGPNDETFIAAVKQVARYELDLLEDPVTNLQASSAGRHVSVTLHLDVDSATQVITIYRKLRQVDGLRMLM
jgi:uncharacterized protein